MHCHDKISKKLNNAIKGIDFDLIDTCKLINITCSIFNNILAFTRVALL